MIKIAKEGSPFVVVPALLTVIVYFIAGGLIAVLPFLATIFMAYFFRDPERMPLSDKGYLSPADGRVIVVRNTYEDIFIKGNTLQISIFMSPLNVHVNRSPCPGTVLDVRHTPGGFMAAYREEASLTNENTAMLLGCGKSTILVRQVAGFLARRTVCRVKAGDSLNRGQRYGLIKFGSRLDVYLPEGTQALVETGQKVKAGTTVIGI